MSGHPLAAGRAQDRESPPAEDRRSTTEPTPPMMDLYLIFQFVKGHFHGNQNNVERNKKVMKAD